MLATSRYVIFDPATGKFLRVWRGSYSRSRTWVDDLKDATVWKRPGDASNAWLCAYELKQVKNRPVEVKRVALVAVETARTIKVGTITESGLWADGSGKRWTRKRRGIVDARR